MDTDNQQLNVIKVEDGAANVDEDETEDENEDKELFHLLDSLLTFDDRVLRLLGAELAHNSSNNSLSNNRDVLNKQIDAFEKLVNHAISRFSVERIHRVLLRVAEPPFPSSPIRISPKSRAAKNESPIQSPNLLDSISKLRESMVKLKRRSHKSNTDNLVINNIDIFLRDIQYMKNLKRYFDDKIYSILYRFFYDPGDLLEDEPIASSKEEQSGVGFFMTEPDEILEDKLKEKKKKTKKKVGFVYGLDIDYLTEKEQLAYAVEELYHINAKWENLIQGEDTVNIDMFDLDSEVEVQRFTFTEFTYSLLRLMPDLFVKCQKSIELAKLWWRQAIAIYKLETPDSTLVAPAPISNYKEKMKQIIRGIEDKDTEIRKQEHNINIHQMDLQFLESRENRVKTLHNSSEKLEQHRNQIGDKYRLLIKERSALVDLIENTVKGTSKYNDLSEKLRQMDLQVIDQYRELKVLEYSLDVQQSEFSVELEVKPSFVIFSETSKINMERAKTELARLLVEKRKLERRYLLMKTNQERMVEILARVEKQGDVTQRPKSNHTYTIRKVTSEERKNVAVTSLKPTAAYVFTKAGQDAISEEDKGRGSESQSLVVVHPTDTDPTPEESKPNSQEQLAIENPLNRQVLSPIPVMTKSRRPRPSETLNLKQAVN